MSTIDVWLAFYGEIGDEALLAKYRELLTESERRQEPRFYFADDRKRYLITRALVRTVLSRYADIAPADWIFTANAYGRPEIAAFQAAGRHLSFNISHTKALIALAITQHRALGVDVENIVERPVSIEIADRFFAPAEVTELARVPAAHQQERFFEYWTFKESYIKARGMGLSIPLDQFSFHYPHEQGVGITISPELGDQAERWSFWQFQPRPEYLLALCAERLDDTPVQLTIRKVVPNHSEELLHLPVLKTSCPF